jgi:hypothetical protein
MTSETAKQQIKPAGLNPGTGKPGVNIIVRRVVKIEEKQ